jgi:inositol oxygenase
MDLLRNYNTTDTTIRNHYQLMRQNQTLDFVNRMEEKYFNFNKAQMSIQEAFDKLKDYVDNSDPDVQFPNLEHMYQTAESMRKAGLPDWFQLVGLIHDMGKIMFL